MNTSYMKGGAVQVSTLFKDTHRVVHTACTAQDIAIYIGQ